MVIDFHDTTFPNSDQLVVHTIRRFGEQNISPIEIGPVLIAPAGIYLGKNQYTTNEFDLQNLFATEKLLNLVGIHAFGLTTRTGGPLTALDVANMDWSLNEIQKYKHKLQFNKSTLLDENSVPFKTIVIPRSASTRGSSPIQCNINFLLLTIFELNKKFDEPGLNLVTGFVEDTVVPQPQRLLRGYLH